MYRYTEETTFVRDAPTVLAYASLGAWTFWLYGFGPAVTLLREELDFSYTLLGLYSVLLALGAALAGATFAALARRVSRPRLLWASTVVTVVAAVLFTLGRGVPVTLLAAALLGVGGATLLTVVQAVLSDRHGPRREQALTEANIAAGASAVVAPLVLGTLAASALGWRVAFAVPVVVFGLLFLRYRNLPLPEAADRGHAADLGRGLPLACWFFAVLTAVSSAIEFCIVYFGPPRLLDTGLSAAAASVALGGNYLGILVGRILGARFTRRPGRGVALLYGSLALAVLAFVVFWLIDQPALAVAGLFLCGMGIANLYPISMALALETAPGREDRANARTQLLLGLIGAASPFLLGSLADRYGLTTAFTLVPVFIGLGVLLLWGGLRARSTTGS